MSDYTIRNLQLILHDTIIAVFMPSVTPELAEQIAFCLNMGCDVVAHLTTCKDGGLTLDAVVFARIDKSGEVAR